MSQPPRQAVAVLVQPEEVEVVAKRKPGRPRKIVTLPTADERDYHEYSAKLQQAIADADPLVGTIEAKKPTPELLAEIKIQIAREAAALRADRLESTRCGRKDVGQLASRRVDAMNKIAHLELESAKLGARAIDLRGEQMQKVERMFIELVVQAAEDVLPPDVASRLTSAFEEIMVGWQDKFEEG